MRDVFYGFSFITSNQIDKTKEKTYFIINNLIFSKQKFCYLNFLLCTHPLPFLISSAHVLSKAVLTLYYVQQQKHLRCEGYANQIFVFQVQ